MSSSLCKNRNKSTLLFLKSDLFFAEKKMLKSSSDTKIKNKKKCSLSYISKEKEKEKIKIIWSEGGKNILLTGTFCNWDKLYSMKKDSKDDCYYYILNLPKGFYQFKFKVDGQWKNSTIYPKYNNHGTINNYLNTSSSNGYNSVSTNESSTISSPISNNKKNNNKIINNTNINSINSNNNIDFSFSKKNYCNYYPKIKEMREYTDKKPTNFQIECYHGVNQIQNNIGNKKYLFLENDIFSGDYSNKKIERKDHILLNHLCQKQKNKKTIINSVVFKYRHKNCTFLYYK